MPPKTDADAGAIEVPLPDHELGIANAKEDDEAAPSDEESPPAAKANANTNEGNPVAIAVAEKKEEEDEKLFSFLTGMKNDLIARKPYYNFKLDCNGGGNGDNNNNKKKKKNADNDNDVPRIDVVGIVSSTTSNGNESSSYEPIRGDWSIPKNFFTVFNATIFAFVIQLIPALIFAELMDRQT